MTMVFGLMWLHAVFLFVQQAGVAEPSLHNSNEYVSRFFKSMSEEWLTEVKDTGTMDLHKYLNCVQYFTHTHTHTRPVSKERNKEHQLWKRYCKFHRRYFSLRVAR